MKSFSRSFTLVKQSFAVLRQDKELLLFPLISGIVEILVIVSFTFPIRFFLGDMRNIQTSTNTYVFYAYLFIVYFVSYFVVVFFNSGLVYCAHKRLHGGDPTFQEGLHFSLRHISKIFTWVLLAATVGVVLRMISDRAGIFGKVIAFLGNTAWNLVTYLIIPVLVFEDKGVIDSFKFSAELFKKTWGEQITGGISMGFFFGLLILLPLIPFIAAMYFLVQSAHFSVPLFGGLFLILVMYYILLSIISSALQGIFTAALYMYAKTGIVPSSFSQELVKGGFKNRTSSVKLPQNSLV